MYSIECISLDNITSVRHILQFNAPVYFTSILPCPVKLQVPDILTYEAVAVHPNEGQEIYCIDTQSLKSKIKYELEVDREDYIETEEFKPNFKASNKAKIQKIKFQGKDYCANKLQSQQVKRHIYAQRSIDFELSKIVYGS